MLKRGRVANYASPPSNSNATVEARLLYARLKNKFGFGSGSERGFFIGANESGGESYSLTTNRLRALTGGKSPLFLTTFPRRPIDAGYSDLVSRVKAHYAAGGICATIVSPASPIVGIDSHDRDRDSAAHLESLLAPSGSKLALYRQYLDEFADSVNNDMAVDGVKIPMLVRLFGESNGWMDYPDRTVLSLSRSGTTATMQIYAAANVGSGFGSGNKFQIRGASDAGWNAMWTVWNITTNTSTTATVTFVVPSSLAAAPTGIITSYATAGYFWAGADRAAQHNELVRQTVDYLRDVKGCNQLIFGSNCFTYNRIYSTTDNTTQPYSQWLSGMENYYDFVSVNIYQDNPISWGYHDFGAASVVDGFNVWAEWAESHGRPIFIHEYGALDVGLNSPDFWSAKCYSAFDLKWHRCIGAAHFRQPWLPDVGTPAGNDLAIALSNPRYRWLA